ncbi:hypothetical protein JNB48_19685 [Escherichia coli]|uniref:hypothetical protein n=1 Tax=Escherichia coli TaxID=562 RepID=UPI00192D88A4|nr:hypothetical protein [Escherichia coli]MBL6363832.1 hypothetical protein [Escherichia coli]
MKYIIRLNKVKDRKGEVVSVPPHAICFLYGLSPKDCVICGSPAHAALSPDEAQHYLPVLCMGLAMRWEAIQDEFKAGIDNEDTRRLKEYLLAVG